MNNDLVAQLEAYGDLFAGELDTLTVKDVIVTRKGEGNVKTLEPVRPIGDLKKNRKGPWLAAAVLVAVLTIGAILAAVFTSGESDVVDDPTTTVLDSNGLPPFATPAAAAEAYAAAFAVMSWDDYLALWTDDSRNVSGEAGYSALAPDEQQQVYAYRSLIGERLSLVDCLNATATEATCTFELTSEPHAALGASPDRFQNRVEIDAAGRIDQVEFLPGGTYDPVWDEIDPWYLDIPGPWNRLAFLESSPQEAAVQLDDLIARYQNGEL